MADQLEQKKEAGLINTQGKGRGTPCRLTSLQQEQLRQRLSQQDFWSLPQIGQLIEQDFACTDSQSGLHQLLKRMNLYHYKQQPRDYRQSPTAQQQLQTRLQATLDAMTLR